MPNLYRNIQGWRWNASADENNAPPGTLLRADNVVFDEELICRLRRGSSILYSSLNGGSYAVDVLYDAFIDDVRYRFAGVDNKVYVNGTDLGIEFDGSGPIAFGNWLGQVFMARGKTKKKYDGTSVTNWGIDKPATKPSVDTGAVIEKFFSTCNSGESPAWSASEGTITGAYPDGHSGQANGSVEVTPAASGRATITRTFATDQDYWTIEGYEGADSDVIDFMVWLSKPEDVETVSILVGVTDGSDAFKDDYYEFVFKIGGVGTKVESEGVEIRSTEAMEADIARRIRRRNAGSSTGEIRGGPNDSERLEDEPLPDDTADVVDDLDDPAPTHPWPTSAAYNPGWVHFTVPRGSMERVGSTKNRDWKTVRGVRIVYKAVTSSSGTARFDDVILKGGGESALTGEYQFLYQAVAAMAGTERQYNEISPPSEPSEPVKFSTQGAVITIPERALQAVDPQANQLWHYITGGLLDGWYRAAITGRVVNDLTAGIDEFPRSPDGTVSEADRARLASFGPAIPGSSEAFSPDSIAGLTLWLDASDLSGYYGTDDLVGYWQGKHDEYSNFAPTDISSLKCWLKANDGVYSDSGTTAAVEGDSVQQWSDQSGTGAHFRQTTAANKPIYRVGIVNGKAVVRFDGVDDHLVSIINASSFMDDSNTTAIVVYKANNVSTNSGTLEDNDSLFAVASASKALGLTLTSGSTLNAYNNDGAIETAQRTAVAHGSWSVAVFRHSAGTTLTVDHNNAHSSSATISGSTVGATSNLANLMNLGNGYTGTNFIFEGDIAEVLFFNAALDDEKLTKLYRYLALKYGLAMPTTNHMSTGLAYGAAQYTAADKPVYKAAVSTLNNRPAVYFDGSTDFMYLDGIGDTLATATDATVFVVATVDAADAGAGAGSLNNNGLVHAQGGRLGILFTGNSTQGYNEDSGGVDFTTARSFLHDKGYCFTLLHSGGTVYQGLNDSRGASMNSATSGDTVSLSAGAMRIGAGPGAGGNYPFQGWIAEVLVYNTGLSEANRQLVESYLATKYSLDIPYSATASFDGEAPNADDLILRLAASEVTARIQGVRLLSVARKPPDNIIAIAGPYKSRFFVLNEDGYLYPSAAGNPSLYQYNHARRISDKTDTPLWMRATRDGLYVGTSRDIWKLSGTGTEFPDGDLDLRVDRLNVGDPPIDSMIATDGNVLVYRAAKGYMILSNDGITAVPMNDIERLYFGEDRYVIDAINSGVSSTFRACVSNDKLYVVTPEGGKTNISEVIYIYDFRRQRWMRHSWLITTWKSIWRERDGTVVAGDTAGNVWQLEDPDASGMDNSVRPLVTIRMAFDDDGAPLNLKDSFEADFEINTGGRNLATTVQKNGSGTAVASFNINMTGNVGWWRTKTTMLGAFKSVQFYMSAQLDTLEWRSVNLPYRVRPQHRIYVDTGYIRTNRERLHWFRTLELSMRAEADFTVKVYFDDVLVATKTVTATTGVVTVYRVPLGRECKGYVPRVVVETVSSSTSTDVGFEIYWLKFRHRRSGDDYDNDIRFTFTDLADAPGVKATDSPEKG